MAANKTSAFNQIPGLANWARAVDDAYNWDGISPRRARELLPEAYKYVQRASGLGRWMFEISRAADTEANWNLLPAANLAGSQIQASSPFGVWMREVSRKV